MLTHLTNSVFDKIKVIDRYLSLSDACDKAVTDAGNSLHRELATRSLLQVNPVGERVFRHCVTITHLYALYEAFCEAAVAFWLSRLPRYKIFPSLSQTFRNAYRFGIAQIIKDADKRRYRHLAVDDVLQKYLDSLKGKTEWLFVADALTTHDTNLRRSEFEKMMHSVGLDGAWSHLQNNTQLINLTVNGPSNKSLEQWLLDLVTYRNDASHGAPEDIFGMAALREWVAFVGAFCAALAQFVTYRLVQEEATYKPESVYGIVTKTYQNSIAVVTCDHGQLHVGDRMFFLRPTKCVPAEILSLQINNVPVNEVTISRAGFEVGIRTSVTIPRHSQMLRIQD